MLKMARIYRIVFSGILAVFILSTFVCFQVLNEETAPSNIQEELYNQFEVEHNDDETEHDDDEAEHIGDEVEHNDDEDEDVHISREQYEGEARLQEEELKKGKKDDSEIPILLWWTPFTHQKWKRKTCGKKGQECFMTEDRVYINHTNTKVLIFYGTDFPVGDMPVPRNPNHEWALIHEESPKNVYMYSHSTIMDLFNHTSTFKRESDYPIPMQFLKSLDRLETTQYLVSTEEKNKRLSELALVNYVHSDCNTPADRDHFVDMLQRYMKVDSYGECKHNKDLPEDLRDPLRSMLKPKFLHFLANYKFSLATENAICDDYMTEKFWRPFIVGSVPIVIGSPKAREFLPAENSAIFVEDYDNVEDLIKYLEYLDNNDEEYEKYLEYKRTGVQNKRLKQMLKARDWNAENAHVPGKYYHFVEGFECFLCRRIHENIERVKQNKPPLKFQAT